MADGRSSKLNELEAKLARIGRQMVGCIVGCPGVQGGNDGDRARGISPRCLVFELDEQSEEGIGSVVVGINPGSMGNEEATFFKENGCSYDQVLEAWRKWGNHHPYHERLRKFVRECKFTGPILWTELAKCESKPGVKELPLQTFRVCVGNYLSRELELIPSNWPLIGVGREAYKALAFRYPDRVVIGVPHPTGARGHFARLFENGRLRENFVHPYKELWNNNKGQAVWIG